ncbi:MAG: plasmid recombination protein [Roseibium sp.]
MTSAPNTFPMGYQFIHLETYSRKADSEGHSVDWILAEARRDPEASLHVESPQAPELIYGIELEELASVHECLADEAKTTLKNGKTRKIRRDQKSLLTVVASYPVPIQELPEKSAGSDSLKRWEQRSIAWLQSLHGNDLVSVIRHTDERYPHIHAYILPRSDPELRAQRLHPGYEAKRTIMDSDAADSSKKELNRRGDKAYRDAMRDWQNSYHQAVGVPCGLTRLGPKRRRLSREAWQAEKVAAKALKTAEVRAEKYVQAVKSKGSAYADQVKAEAAEIRRTAETWAVQAKAAQARATRLERRAQGILERAKLEAARVLSGIAPYRKFGALVRSIWDGLNTVGIQEKARSEFAQQVKHLSKQASEERASRQRAEERATELANIVQGSGLVQAATSREVSRLKRRLEAEIGSKTKMLTPQIAVRAPSGGRRGS